MTTKEKFLQNILTEIKELQLAYDNSKNLPDRIFESLNGSVKANIPKVETIKRKDDSNGQKEYGANANAVRELLKATSEGLTKSEIIDKFPNAEQYEPAIVYTMVTNVLSALNQNDEIEKYKPRGKKMRGYYWKLKS